ncbi:hypothetical protein FBR01_08375 [Anaerolineae bacterium CFX8]|nr:hypothetical protein [Anaerolineae bacterium CFX8]
MQKSKTTLSSNLLAPLRGIPVEIVAASSLEDYMGDKYGGLSGSRSPYGVHTEPGLTGVRKKRMGAQTNAPGEKAV